MITRKAIPERWNEEGTRRRPREEEGRGRGEAWNDNKIYYRGWRRGSIYPVSRGTHNHGISRNLNEYTGILWTYPVSVTDINSDLKNLERPKVDGFHKNKEFAKFSFRNDAKCNR